MILKCFFIIIGCILLNKFLISIRKYLENRVVYNNKSKDIPNRSDLVGYGMDYYLNLCKYIISNMDNTSYISIEDITGREVIDIKFTQNNTTVYASCLLKDVSKEGEFDLVTYDDVLELLNYMIKDGVNNGIIFTNSYLDDDAKKFVNDLNKNSNTYNIELMLGYEIIKFARKRNEENNKEFMYA